MAVGDMTILAVAQTIVCATEIRGKRKQGLAPRLILLPNRDQRQQVLATLCHAARLCPRVEDR
jgi:hypothetical protein